ncbi:Gfo/Idh/MocA family oxidoreductase [Paenibacillus sp. YSY-4.3]
MSRLNAVIIGCGAIGPIHTTAVKQSEAARLYGACDITEERAQKLAGKDECRVYTDFSQVLSDEAVHSVHICTPHHLHADMAIQAALAGKHIVLEKPVAMNVAEARLVSDAVKKAGVSCCAILQNRLNPSIKKAKELITEGTLGPMLGIKGFLTWRRTADYYQSDSWRGKWATEGGGLLINQAVHMLDLLYYLGGDVEAVRGNIDTRVLRDIIEVEDTAEATLYYKDGKVGLFYATNGHSENSPFFIEMHMEKGLLRYIDNQLVLISDGEMQLLESDINIDKSAPSLGKSYWGTGHAKLIDRFYRNLAGGNDSYIALRETAYSMGLLDAIYASSRNHCRKNVELF